MKFRYLSFIFILVSTLISASARDHKLVYVINLDKDKDITVNFTWFGQTKIDDAYIIPKNSEAIFAIGNNLKNVKIIAKNGNMVLEDLIDQTKPEQALGIKP